MSSKTSTTLKSQISKICCPNLSTKIYWLRMRVVGRIRLEQLQTIENSKRTPEEKELLTKAAKGEIKWTKEVMDLYKKAVRDTEE